MGWGGSGGRLGLCGGGGGVGGVWGEEWGGEEVGGGGEARAGEGEHVGPCCEHSAILDLNRESCHRPEKLGSAVGIKICARMLKAQLMHTNANEFPLKAHLCPLNGRSAGFW